MGFPSAPDAELADASSGVPVHGPEPDGYMSMPQLVEFFEQYAASFERPSNWQTVLRSGSRRRRISGCRRTAARGLRTTS